MRHGASFFYFESGSRTDEHARVFVDQILSLMEEYGGKTKRLAVDKIEKSGYAALSERGVTLLDGQALSEQARAIKNDNELAAIVCAIYACEQAMSEMRDVVQAGATENDVWAELHAGNIRRGGEWIETRLLASGPRTNPWFQECGPRVMNEGDILAFDTDMISVYGYCCDISRTWLVGDGKPNETQKTLYKVAYEHIMSNINLLKPGMSLNEVTEKAHRLPPQYRALRYGVLAHGVGLCDEYPSIRYPEDLDACGYSGVIEPGMTLSVEAYIGETGGREGVKLEEQILITETGTKTLSSYPFEDDFLS